MSTAKPHGMPESGSGTPKGCQCHTRQWNPEGVPVPYKGPPKSIGLKPKAFPSPVGEGTKLLGE